MRLAFASIFLLLFQASAHEPPIAQPDHLAWQRELRLPAASGQACAVLDAQIFPHAEPSLKDLRIFPVATSPSDKNPPHEIPYAITVSDTETKATDPARVLNLGSMAGKGSSIVFDLEMPQRAYSDVTLDLDGRDFLAVAAVSGTNTLGGKETALGVFTLFDLSSQRLSRHTTLPLEESTFHYLHIVLTAGPAPGSGPKKFTPSPSMVQGAAVPPSRIDQMIFTPVAETTTITTEGRQSKATFIVPQRVPVERISFVLKSEFKGNFSRDVTITATPQPMQQSAANSSNAAGKIAEGADLQSGTLPTETLTGTILRVHQTGADHEIRTDELSVPIILGANLQSPERVEVTLANGDDRPLPIAAVRLEMRQRKICFDAAAGITPMLYYGDPALATPVYDYDRLFQAGAHMLSATLGPEQPNPTYQPPPPEVRPFTERHPEVLWIALIAVVCVLGMVALKSSRNVAA